MEALSRDTGSARRVTCIGCTLQWISEAEINEKKIDGESNRASNILMFQSLMKSWMFSCTSRANGTEARYSHGISRLPSHASIVPKPCTYCQSLLTIRLGHHFCFWSPQSLQNSPSGSNMPADRRSSVLGAIYLTPATYTVRLSQTNTDGQTIYGS